MKMYDSMNQVLWELFTNLTDTAFSCVKIVVRSGFFNLRLPRALADEEIVVLGNGPSLKEVLEKYPQFIDTRRKMCVNSFAISDYFEKIKPEYYVIADPGWWIANPLEEVKQLKEKVVANLEKSTWSLDFLLPREAKGSDFIHRLKTNPSIRIFYYNKTTTRGFSWFTNLVFRMKLGIPRPQNVLIPALVTAINMGYKKIFIVGADHSWHETISVSEQNRVSLRHEHFAFLIDSFKTHIPFKDIHTGKDLPIHRQFESLAITFKNYHIIKDYADYKKAVIYNASIKSYIDAFERLDLNKLTGL